MNAPQKPVIVWFRQDLRLADNPALTAAVKTGAPVLPIYILDDRNAGDWAMGGASRVWLHHSLNSLNTDLSGGLACYSGDALKVLTALAQAIEPQAVFWNRCYEPWRVARDTAIKAMLDEAGITAKSYNGSLLFEPWDIKKDDGTPYRVFTPFFRRGCMKHSEPPMPLPVPNEITLMSPKPKDSGDIASLNLLPGKIRWDKTMVEHWAIGEDGATQRLREFLDDGLDNYKQGRNNPAQNNVSRLSPYLHFGEISPRTAWHAVRQFMIAEGLETDGDHFLSELGWREFSYSLLYFNHDLPTEPLQKRFNKFPWVKNKAGLRAWQRGMTGYPIVDAGMRELWQTGYMHNRVRMIVGSFLVKDLMLHWTEGEKWFWDTLFDADLSNNAASWQWIAGCGADAAPYFRIFNPVGQGEKFDPDGEYIRRYCPELANLPNDLIHHPWDAEPLELKAAGITLGKTYPHPIVDHKKARDAALAAFQMTKD